MPKRLLGILINIGKKRNKLNSQDIKELRKRLNLTQQQLADRIGVDRITVIRWEAGQRKPSNLAQRELLGLQQQEVKIK